MHENQANKHGLCSRPDLFDDLKNIIYPGGISGVSVKASEVSWVLSSLREPRCCVSKLPVNTDFEKVFGS